MVGRESESVLLQEQLVEAERGLGRLAIIGGEAGIGKTTLSRHLAETGRHRGFRILAGSSYDLMSASPYGMWLDLGDGYTASQAAGPPLPEGLTVQGLEHISSQATLFAETIMFLRNLAGQGPVLLFLEDVHWSDPVSLELLRHVASHISGIPVLVVVTYRIDELTHKNPFYRHLPALIRESEGIRIDLKPLAMPDLDRLVTMRYGMTPDESALVVSYLVQRSDGNPFFAIELLRTLEETGGLEQRETGWVVRELDHLMVPNLIKQVIEARVSRLGDLTREHLATAAVIGQDVDLDLWSRAADVDALPMLAMIESAVEMALLHPSRDGRRVRFAHALTREALYEGITPMRRRMIHRTVAAVLRQERPHDPDPIAYHLQHAGDDDAVTWLVAAGERAQRAYAWLTARDRFQAAADQLEGEVGQDLARARLLYRCGRLQRYSDAASGIRDLEIAARLADQAGDAVLAADAEYSMGVLQCFADQWALGVKGIAFGIDALEAMAPGQVRSSWSTMTWMADSLPSVQRMDGDGIDPAARHLLSLRVNHRRGGQPWFMAAAGNGHEARSIATGFIGHVDGVDAGPLVLSATAHAHFGLGIVGATLGDPAGARQELAAARAIYEQIDHHAVIAFTYITELCDVVIPYFADDVGLRRLMASEASLALERAGGAFPSDVAHRRANLIGMYLDGYWHETRDLCAGLTIHGSYPLRRLVTRSLAPIALHQGQTREAWSQVTAVLPDGTATLPGSALLLDALPMQEIAFTLCLDSMALDDARLWLNEHQRWLEWSEAVTGRVEHAMMTARLAAAEGEIKTALSHASQAVAAAQNPRQPLAELQARRLHGRLLAESGQLARARPELDAAQKLAIACTIPYEQALCNLELARAISADQPEAARALIDRAQEVFISLDAVPAMADVAGIRDRLTASEPRDASLFGLTTREIDVLKLVAHGLTDAEVATRLYISTRTVNHHLQSVYSKLDIHSRAGATRFAIEHQLS